MISNCIDYKIDGFGVSYCSALFHFHFPKLIPVLDRRVLIGISIVAKAEQMTSEGQVRDIENHYTDLIEKLRHELISGRFADLDKADEHYFKMKIPVYLRRNALKNLHEKIS